MSKGSNGGIKSMLKLQNTHPEINISLILMLYRLEKINEATVNQIIKKLKNTGGDEK